LAVGAWLANTILTRWLSIQQIIKATVIVGLILTVIFLGMCMMQQAVELLLVPLFFIILTLGILFPTTTKLALEPFHENSGSASALLGSLQLIVTFSISAITNVLPMDLLLLTGVAFLTCHLLYLLCFFIPEDSPMEKKESMV